MQKAPKQPAADPKPLGIDASRTSSNETARAAAWGHGRNRFAVQWVMGQPFNQRTTEIKQKVGKKTQTTGYNVYADIGGFVKLGKTHALEAIIIDGTVAWAGPVYRADHPTSYTGTIPSYGQFCFHWGLPDQAKDALIFGGGG